MPLVSRAKKIKALNILCDYFLKQGNIPTPSEFNKDPNRPTSITASIIRGYFGNWGKMQNAISKLRPEDWNQLTAPKAKPAVKSAVKKGKVDGKDI